MKKLILLSAILLTGCSTIAELWPKAHDPVMFDRIISVQIKMDRVDCAEKDVKWNWTQLLDELNHLKVYTEVRKDPQATNIAQLEEATNKAFNSKNEVFCKSIISLNKTRIKVVEDAWRGR